MINFYAITTPIRTGQVTILFFCCYFCFFRSPWFLELVSFFACVCVEPVPLFLPRTTLASLLVACVRVRVRSIDGCRAIREVWWRDARVCVRVCEWVFTLAVWHTISIIRPSSYERKDNWVIWTKRETRGVTARRRWNGLCLQEVVEWVRNHVRHY